MEATSGDSTNRVGSFDHLYDTLRIGLLCSSMACIISSTMSVWYLGAAVDDHESAVDDYESDDAMTLGDLLTLSNDDLTPSNSYAILGLVLTAILWVCGALSVSAESERGDALLTVLAALGVLSLIACHSTLTSAARITAGPGLPLMLLALVLAGTCAVRLRR